MFNLPDILEGVKNLEFLILIILIVIIACVYQLAFNTNKTVSGIFEYSRFEIKTGDADCPFCTKETLGSCDCTVPGGCECGLSNVGKNGSQESRESQDFYVLNEPQVSKKSKKSKKSKEPQNSKTSNDAKILVAKLVKNGDKQEIAAYLGKACKYGDEQTAAELLAMRGDIITLLSGSPGLIDYISNIPKAENKDVEAILDCIKNALPRGYKGAFEIGHSKKGKEEGAEEFNAKQVYDALKPYISEVGNVKHIEDYLSKKFSLTVSKADIPSDIESNKIIKHKILYTIIKKIIDQEYIRDLPTFITKTKLRYEHFLPKVKLPLLELSDKYDINIIIDLRNELKVLVSGIGKSYTDQELDGLLRRLESSLAVYRFAPGFAKKPKSSIIKAKAKAFRVDYLALLPVLDAINDAVKFGQSSKIFDTISLLGLHTPSASEERDVREYISSNMLGTAKVYEPSRELRILRLLNKYPSLVDLTKSELDSIKSRLAIIMAMPDGPTKERLLRDLEDALTLRDILKLEKILRPFDEEKKKSELEKKEKELEKKEKELEEKEKSKASEPKPKEPKEPGPKPKEPKEPGPKPKEPKEIKEPEPKPKEPKEPKAPEPKPKEPKEKPPKHVRFAEPKPVEPPKKHETSDPEIRKLQRTLEMIRPKYDGEVAPGIHDVSFKSGDKLILMIAFHNNDPKGKFFWHLRPPLGMSGESLAEFDRIQYEYEPHLERLAKSVLPHTAEIEIPLRVRRPEYPELQPIGETPKPEESSEESESPEESFEESEETEESEESESLEESLIHSKEAAKRAEEEARSQEAETRRLEEENRRLKEAAIRAEEEARRQEAETRRREEENRILQEAEAANAAAIAAAMLPPSAPLEDIPSRTTDFGPITPETYDPAVGLSESSEEESS